MKYLSDKEVQYYTREKHMVVEAKATGKLSLAILDREWNDWPIVGRLRSRIQYEENNMYINPDYIEYDMT